MRRAPLLALTLVLACSSTAPHPSSTAPQSSTTREPPPPPGFGKWGEHEALVPSWVPEQERRAPKVPAGDKIWKAIAPSHVERLDDALLVCSVEVTDQIPWDALFGPDVLLRWHRNHDPVIAQWGPEDHWRFYVSIPRFTLARGDVLGVEAYDRDSSSDELIGTAVVRWDGELPLQIAADTDGGVRFSMDCRALPYAEALARVKPRLAKIDEKLAALESPAPDPDKPWWGKPVWIVEGLRGMFDTLGATPLRYAAGFIGWEDPLIQERIARLDRLERAWNDAIRARVKELVASAPATGTWTEVRGTGLRIQASRDPAKPSRAIVHLEWIDARRAEPLACSIPDSSLGPLRIAGVGDDGGDLPASDLTLLDGTKRTRCGDLPPVADAGVRAPAGPIALSVELPVAATPLLRLVTRDGSTFLRWR